MDKETAKAINNVNKRLNEVAQRLDNFLNGRIDENKESIEENTTGLMETYEETVANAESISDVELALEEVYEMMEGLGE